MRSQPGRPGRTSSVRDRGGAPRPPGSGAVPPAPGAGAHGGTRGLRGGRCAEPGQGKCRGTGRPPRPGPRAGDERGTASQPLPCRPDPLVRVTELSTADRLSTAPGHDPRATAHRATVLPWNSTPSRTTAHAALSRPLDLPVAGLPVPGLRVPGLRVPGLHGSGEPLASPGTRRRGRSCCWGCCSGWAVCPARTRLPRLRRPEPWSCPRPATPVSPRKWGAGRATRPGTAIPRAAKWTSRWPGGPGRSGEEAVPDGHGCRAAGTRRPNHGRRATAGSTSRRVPDGRCARWRRAGCRSPDGSRGGGWCPSSSAARGGLRCGRRTSRCGPPYARAIGCVPGSGWARSCAALTVRAPACTGGCCGASATSTRSPCCPPRSSADPPGCCRSAGCRFRVGTVRRRSGGKRRTERVGRRGRRLRPAEAARPQASARRFSYWAHCGRTGG